MNSTKAFFASLFGQYYYRAENGFMAKLNQVLNGRLQFGYNAIHQYGIALLGKYIKWVGQGTLKAKPDSVYNYVDNALLQLTINYGVIFMILLVPTVLAVILGYLTFTNRIKGVYFSILSQALALVFVTLFIGMQQFTGGTNGLTDFDKLFGLSLHNMNTKYIWYYVALGFLILTYIVFNGVLKSKCGRVLVAIRDGENRTRFSGYYVAMYKTFVYALSALFTGIAGALFVPFSGIISPSEMSISNSIDMAIWVAVGGRGSLIGAVIGAFVVNLCKTCVSENFPEIWSYFIGLLFVLVVMFLPRGLTGVFMDARIFIAKKIKKMISSEKSAVSEEA